MRVKDETYLVHPEFGFCQMGLKLPTDGKGLCLDKVFVERLWRAGKYDEIYLRSY
jgi:hypothetical protein